MSHSLVVGEFDKWIVLTPPPRLVLIMRMKWLLKYQLTFSTCRKDVSLPQDMQRSMAAEAEAERVAKAKVRGPTV